MKVLKWPIPRVIDPDPGWQTKLFQKRAYHQSIDASWIPLGNIPYTVDICKQMWASAEMVMMNHKSSSPSHEVWQRGGAELLLKHVNWGDSICYAWLYNTLNIKRKIRLDVWVTQLCWLNSCIGLAMCWGTERNKQETRNKKEERRNKLEQN